MRKPESVNEGDVDEKENSPTSELTAYGRHGFTGNAALAAQLVQAPSFIRMNFMLCFNLCNGVLLASYMLLVLPLESQKIDATQRSIVLGSLMFIAGITQLINPMVGLLSDRCTFSWGRRRVFVLAGGFCGAVGIVIQDFASVLRIPSLYYLAYTISMLALNTAYTAVVGIMSDLVPAELSGTASSIAAFHTVAGANLGFLVYNNVDGDPNQRLHAMYMAFVGVTVFTVVSTLLACNEVPLVKNVVSSSCEKGVEDVEQEADVNAGRIMVDSRLMASPLRYKDLIGAYYIDPRKHFDFTLVFWSRTLYYFGGSVQAFLKYYLQDVVGIADAEAAIVKTAIIGQICAAITSVPTGLVSDRMGRIRKPFIYFACMILAVGQVVICFARTEFELFVVCGVIGCANGMYLAMDAALALDTLPSGEEAARFMGVWGIGCFVGGALGPCLGGPILAMCGRNPLKSEAYHYVGYLILFGMAAACFLVSGVILYYVGWDAAYLEYEVASLQRYFRCRTAETYHTDVRSTSAVLGWIPLSRRCIYFFVAVFLTAAGVFAYVLRDGRGELSLTTETVTMFSTGASR